MGKLRPAGHIQPIKGKNTVQKHVFFNETQSKNCNIHANVVNEQKKRKLKTITLYFEMENQK